MKRVLKEFIWLGAIGTVIGLGLNAVSPKGISIGVDHFPKSPWLAQTSPATHSTSASSSTDPDPHAGGQAISAADALVEQVRRNLQAKGLNTITHQEVKSLYEDPAYASGSYVIIDARNRELYLSGHIPGAYHLDAYRVKEMIEPIRSVLSDAIKIVIYCNGGSCEDSEFAAIHLQSENIDPSRVFVDPSGMDYWKDQDLPVEKGERGSQDIVRGRTLVGGSHG